MKSDEGSLSDTRLVPTGVAVVSRRNICDQSENCSPFKVLTGPIERVHHQFTLL